MLSAFGVSLRNFEKHHPNLPYSTWPNGQRLENSAEVLDTDTPKFPRVNLILS